MFWKKKPPPEPPRKKQFPPVPDWRPAIVQPLERIVDRMVYYTNGKRDFVVFAHGTCVVVPDGLSDEQAGQAAREIVHKIYYAHLDMKPRHMDDGNILVEYNQPAVSIVLSDVANRNYAEIDRNWERALATDEVIITGAGPNVFNDFGKKALFGRCYFFMDAQDPQIDRITRKSA